MLDVLFTLAAALPCAPQTAVILREPQPPPAVAQSSEDELQDLLDEYDDEQDDYYERYRAASAEERKEIRKTKPGPGDYVPRFRELAQQYPGTATAAQAWVWIHSNSRDLEAMAEAFGVLRKDYIKSEHIAPFCRSRGYLAGENEGFLLEALEVNEHDVVKGASCYALGKLYMNMAELSARLKKPSEEDRERLTQRYGDQVIAKLVEADSKALRAKAEEYYQRVLAEYKDLEHYRGTLGTAAEAELFELRHLQIGMVGPDIEGEDIDGVQFKLSDYRGKVVVLDFWGNW